MDLTSTMRIALLSNVHANLPALDAVLADLDRRAVDTIYCLGDLVGFNRWPNAVIGLLRQRRIPTVASALDRSIGRGGGDPTHRFSSLHESVMGRISIDRTNQLIGTAERDHLRALPTQFRLDHHVGDQRWRLLLLHGSFTAARKGAGPKEDEERLLSTAARAGAFIVCHGLSHTTAHRMLEIEGGGVRHVIDTGAVGKPQDRDPRASYAILDIGDVRGRALPEVTVEFVRVPYDVERAARGVVEGELPWMYADMLREGF